MVNPLERLGPRTRKVVRAAGYVLLALVTFVFALQLTFPYDRVKDKIVEALSAKYDTKIGSIERGIWPGSMTLHDIQLRTRPENAEDTPGVLFVKSLEVKVGLLALAGQTAEVDFEVLLVGTENPIEGSIAINADKTEVHIAGDRIPAASLPMRDAVGLPMVGPLSFSVDLLLPNTKSKAGKVASNWQKAEGAITFACPAGCTIGDGKSKLKAKLSNARSQAFAGDGIEFGKINIQSLVAKVEIAKGTLTLTQLDTKSDDGTLKGEFAMKLAPVLDDSDVTGCLRFAGSKGLLEREQRTYTAMTATGAPYGPDELYHIKLIGKFKQIQRKGLLCGPDQPAANADDASSGGAPDRPSITVQGDSPLSPDGDALAVDPAPLNPPPPDQVTPDGPIGPDGGTPVADGGADSDSSAAQPLPAGEAPPPPPAGDPPPPPPEGSPPLGAEPPPPEPQIQ